jgi:hypothetical protein
MRALSAKPREHRARKRHRTPRRLNLIFDADDTLWHSNIHFVEAEQAFIAAAINAGVAVGAAEIAAAVHTWELEHEESRPEPSAYGSGRQLPCIAQSVLDSMKDGDG